MPKFGRSQYRFIYINYITIMKTVMLMTLKCHRIFHLFQYCILNSCFMTPNSLIMAPMSADFGRFKSV